MQITSGTISVVNGDATVTGSPSCDWSQVNTSCFIIIAGISYGITSVQTDPSNSIELSANYSGTTDNDIPYVIVRDFTPNHHLPLLNEGDLEAAAIMSRAIETIDILLSNVSTGDASVEFTVTKTSHGFIVGNVLTLIATGWTYCETGTVGSEFPLCIVSEVVDADTFRARFTGPIGKSGDPTVQPIAGLTLTVGETYFVRTAKTAAGGGGYYNIDVDGPSIGTLKLPVLKADTTSSGIMCTLPFARQGTFALNTDGMVPGFTSGQAGYVLSTIGWVASALSNQSVYAQHLYRDAIVNWTNFATGTTGLSVMAHILDLHARLSVVESSLTSLLAFTNKLRIYPESGAMTVPVGYGYNYYQSWTIPSNVKVVKVSLEQEYFEKRLGFAFSDTYLSHLAMVENTTLEELPARDGLSVFLKVPTGTAKLWIYIYRGNSLFVLGDSTPLVALVREETPQYNWDWQWAALGGAKTWNATSSEARGWLSDANASLNHFGPVWPHPLYNTRSQLVELSW